MAYPFPVHQGVSDEQAEILRELNSFQQVSDSNAWKLISERANLLVSEAEEEMLGCPPLATLEQRGTLQIRWQQRKAVVRDLLGFMESQLEHRKRMIEEIKDEHTDTDTGINGS